MENNCKGISIWNDSVVSVTGYAVNVGFMRPVRLQKAAKNLEISLSFMLGPNLSLLKHTMAGF